jgi:AcrR family transcriptional regulator
MLHFMNGRSHSEPRPKKPLRQRIRETTVQAIMEAAEEVFADQGLHAAHMGDIAARAGVAVGTLYNHFEDREALLAGLLDARGIELLGRIDRGLKETAGKPFREQLRGVLANLLEHKQAHRKFFQILLQGEIGRYQATFPSACHKPSATIQEVLERVERVVKHAVRNKQIRPEAAQLAPILFMGLARAVGIRDILIEPVTDIARESGLLIDLFLDGVGT